MYFLELLIVWSTTILSNIILPNNISSALILWTTIFGRHHDIQHNDLQHNDIQHIGRNGGTQHNDTWHKDCQHDIDTQNYELNGTNLDSIFLSDVMLSAVVLSDAAPHFLMLCCVPLCWMLCGTIFIVWKNGGSKNDKLMKSLSAQFCGRFVPRFSFYAEKS